MTETVEEKLKLLGEELPAAPAAVGFYVPVTQLGNLVMTSGQLPTIGKELTFTGKVGQDLTKEEAHHAAKIAALNALAQIKSCLGTLDRVKRVVRVEGFVQSIDKFYDQPYVLNGASELFTQLYGENGKHTRFAVGTNALPLNASVELSVWVEANDP